MNYPFENDTERIEKRIAEKSVFSEKNRTFSNQSYHLDCGISVELFWYSFVQCNA